MTVGGHSCMQNLAQGLSRFDDDKTMICPEKGQTCIYTHTNTHIHLPTIWNTNFSFHTKNLLSPILLAVIHQERPTESAYEANSSFKQQIVDYIFFNIFIHSSPFDRDCYTEKWCWFASFIALACKCQVCQSIINIRGYTKHIHQLTFWLTPNNVGTFVVAF